jgi:hypothetical protein
MKCEACGKKLAMPFGRKEGWAFHIGDDNGNRYWCKACTETVPEIVQKLEEMERTRRSLRYVPGVSDVERRDVRLPERKSQDQG